MRATIRILPLTLLLLAALLFAACGGAKGSGETGESPAATQENDGSADGDNNGDDADSDDDADGAGPTSGQPASGPGAGVTVSDGVAVLGASAAEFEQEITSMEGGIEMQMTGAGMDISVTADFAFVTPDKMYMSMQMSGDDGSGTDLGSLGDMEFLILGDTYYLNFPLFGGWVYMSLDELGLTDADLQELQSTLSGSMAFDYEALIDGLGGVEFVGEEQLNGMNVLHYSISVSTEDLLAAMGGLEAAGMGLDQVPLEGVTGPVQMDVWVGAMDLLPYKLTMDLDVSVPGQGSFAMDMLMHIDSYNSDVTIPPPPADAKSFDELFGGLFGDPESGGLEGFLPTE
jgi:hypothetical protein